MTQLRNSRTPGFHSTLIAFSLFPKPEPWSEPNYAHLREVYEGARACAERHGYKLELLWLRAPGMSPARFKEILDARGIRGLYCLGSLAPDEPLPEELSTFAIVSHAASLATRTHRVASHFAHDCRSLMQQLQARGYCAPGLVIKASGDRRTDFAYSSTFVGFHERFNQEPHIPILRIEEWADARFSSWFGRNKPDVLIVHHEAAFLRNVMAALRKRRLNVADDIGLALLDKNPDPSRYSGIIQNNRLMGAEGIELLISRIHLEDFGLPAQPKIELVEGCWNEGLTLRPFACPTAPLGELGKIQP